MTNLNAKIRPAAVAGSFYNNNKEALIKEINSYLDKVEKKNEFGDILAIVAPHAGYKYSGWVAAHAYKQVQGEKYDCVIIISPSHTCYFAGSSVYDGDAYETPLGVLELDKDMINLIEANGVPKSDKGHTPDSNGAEHALEVQLPFVQVALGSPKIVPIVMGSQEASSIDQLSNALYRAISESGKKTIIIASSDMSHFHQKKIANSMDSLVCKAFARYDYFYLDMMFSGRKLEACGGAPILVAMNVAERLGGNSAQTLQYATSADSPYISADSNRVVGYFAGIIGKKANAPFVDFPEFTKDEKAAMLAYAREIVKATAERTNLPSFKNPTINLLKDFPVFTTLFKNGDLRGCVGYTVTDLTLIDNIRETAVLASSRDNRFIPVAPAEIDSLEIELSVLSRFQRIYDLSSIEIGKDGLFLQVGQYSGLFLPEVPVEQGWNLTEYLENLSHKAGLKSDAYKNPNARIYRYFTQKIK